MQNEDSAKGKSAQTFMERMSTLTDIFVGTAGLPDLPPFTEYLSMPEGYKAPGGASQNYKSMGRFSRYVYELMTDGPELQNFRRQTLNYFAEESRTGQMVTEQGCSVPHDGMHIGRALLARLASMVYGDDEVEQASREWLAGFLAMCDACADDSGHVAWPGFRIKQAPESQVRDIVYRAAMGLKQKLPQGNKIETERFFLGGRLALLLAELPGGLPDPAPELPKLWAPMTVQRFPGGYLATITEPPGLDGKGRKEAVDWVLSKNGELTYGHSWETPPPPVENVTETLTSKGA
ncbi:MAG TPA: hypothetical protein VF414_13520 [Thermoanaerobaculia bacterium]